MKCRLMYHGPAYTHEQVWEKAKSCRCDHAYSVVCMIGGKVKNGMSFPDAVNHVLCNEPMTIGLEVRAATFIKDNFGGYYGEPRTLDDIVQRRLEQEAWDKQCMEV